MFAKKLDLHVPNNDLFNVNTAQYEVTNHIIELGMRCYAKKK